MQSSSSVCVDLIVSGRLATHLRRVVSVLAVGLAGCIASVPSLAMVELTGISKIAAGYSHTCAITTAGGVKCWGDNSFGQLGDNTTTQRLTPVDVSGLASGVAAITAGEYYTCALTTAGGVKCWGSNQFGQLGDSSTVNRLTPVDVSGFTSGMAAIKAGRAHTCAVATTGGVKCWGFNGDGALGDNSTSDRLTPVDVSGLAKGVTAIAAGGDHTCALTTAGGMKCWGDNLYGELGDNSTTDRLTPVDVSGLASGVATMSAGGAHTCALTTEGGVKCWGYNLFGEIGDGTATFRYIPAPVLTFYCTGTPSGGNSSLSLLANFNIALADVGRTGSFYIAVLLPTGELFFLTPSGFIQYTGGPIPTYSTDSLSNRSITVVSGVNVTPFLGTIVFAGYGLNDADLIGNSKYNAIYTVQ
jgi:DNA-binding transcriptional regulator YdaS (Cro superfamily)